MPFNCWHRQFRKDRPSRLETNLPSGPSAPNHFRETCCSLRWSIAHRKAQINGFWPNKLLLIDKGKIVLSSFWQSCVSGRASGCQKSCKWFVSGDFNNHLHKNISFENNGPWPRNSNIRPLRRPAALQQKTRAAPASAVLVCIMTPIYGFTTAVGKLGCEIDPL